MNRIQSLNARYAASAYLVDSGVQITRVGDSVGGRFNSAVRRLLIAQNVDGPGLWDDLVGASKALRWRLLTQPQPIEFNPGLVELAAEVALHARRLHGAIGDQVLLDELAQSALVVAETDPAVGAVLLRDCLEAGADGCIVIAANRIAKAALGLWLREYGFEVTTVGDLERDQPIRDTAVVVGPPRYYRSSLVTAPVISGISFLLPTWFADLRIPSSAITDYADGAIRISAKVFTEGETLEPAPDEVLHADDEDSYLPQPVWGADGSDEREPGADEVRARKVLLCGNLAIWLDDGERIRSLNPKQPSGERVTYTEVAAVRPGTYLLLRHGATERGALHEAAIAGLGPKREAVDASQRAWKQSLSEQLERKGYRQVVNELRAAGVGAADQAAAWVSPTLIRPNSDQGFEVLLRWLGIPIQPTFGHATMLRKSLYRVSAEITRQLENAVAASDLTELEASGHLSLDIAIEGFRGIVATRVLAISPYFEIVSRHDARVPVEDRSGQWLE